MFLAMLIIRMRDEKVVNWRAEGYDTWTNMLEDSTRTLEFRYKETDKPEDMELRKKILKEFYDLARREEEYCLDSGSGKSIVSY